MDPETNRIHPSSPITMDVLVCASCGAPQPAFTCNECRAEVYCSQTCLTTHWRTGHKQTCLSIRASVAPLRIEDAIDINEFQNLRTVKAVQDAAEEIKKARLIPSTTSWSDNASVFLIMAKIIRTKELDTVVTKEQLVQLTQIVDDPFLVRAKLLYEFKHAPAEAEQQKFADAIRWMTRVILDPLTTEYTEPTPATPLFRRSKRPETYMYLANPRIRNVAVDKTVPLNHWRMPVIRFMRSLERGAFYAGGSDPLACGIFFFFDPDAKTVMHEDPSKVLICANKPHAIIELIAMSDKKHRVGEEDPLYDFGPSAWDQKTDDKKAPRTAFIWLADIFRQQSMYKVARAIQTAMKSEKPDFTVPNFPPPWLGVVSTPDATNSRFSDWKPGDAIINGEVFSCDHAYRIPEQGALKYIGDRFFGVFDVLDGMICNLAKDMGYSTVVLQSEPGRRRAVTEVYHVRNRLTAFDSIIRDMSLPPLPVKDATQPCIWYP